MSVHPDTPTLGDVADPAVCHFCGSDNLHWGGCWADCHDCTASFAYRNGLVTDREDPEDLDVVSDLIRRLREEWTP